jgi:L-ascorbate metabolism protein UlaG (beta-lactamase superfamily)
VSDETARGATAAGLREPVQADEALLADVARTRGAADGFRLWWTGQSGFIVQFRGAHLYLDPYLSESLTHKYASTDKPHVRMTRRVVDPARLDFIDFATSSHNHTDHLDHETLWPLMRANPRLRLVVPEANRQFAADRLKVDPASFVGCDDGVTIDLGPFRITGIPSAHEGIERDEQGRSRFLGYVVQFGGFSLYHSGDCCDWPGLDERLRPFRLDVALLPINGRKPERRVPGNMWGREAADLAQRIGARLVIPHHYQMFAFNTEEPDELLAHARERGVVVRVLRNGERFASDELPARA